MNKQRRKDLAKVLEYLAAANQPLADAITDLEGIRDEEQDAYDGMPEGLQSSERGEAAQAAIDAIGEALAAVEEMASQYDEAVSAIETASE